MTVLYDASKCTGCRACSVACKQWQELPGEKTTLISSIQSQRSFTPTTWTFISFRETAAGPNGRADWLFRKEQCMHCSEAACMKACNYGAIGRTPQGFVVIDQSKCIGCGYCETNCPFHVPRIDEHTNKAFKCHGCPDRVENGLTPACVKTCQTGALTFGPRQDMLSTAAARLNHIKPSYPQANIYGANELGGLHFTYILLREPAFYALPAQPAVPLSLTVWKDVVRPLGGLGVAGALAAAAVGFVLTRRGGKTDDQGPDKGAGLHA